jgi:hypothetical protein
MGGLYVWLTDFSVLARPENLLIDSASSVSWKYN